MFPSIFFKMLQNSALFVNVLLRVNKQLDIHKGAITMTDLFFKDEIHESQFNAILDTVGADNIEVTTLAYLTAATYKGKRLIEEKALNYKFIDDEKFLEVIAPYSSSEKGLLRFALQCYNRHYDTITLPEVLQPLDETHHKIVKNALTLRYKL